MSALSDALLAAGLPIAPFRQAGLDVVLQWDTAQTGPILDDIVLVGLPDLHLASGENGDIFRGNDDAAVTRLLALLRGLVQVSPRFPTLATLQLGDLYDVWRAYPGYSDHPTSDYRVIEDAYGPALGLLTQQLGSRVCVGNHDACLGLYPPSWARTPAGVTDQLAYAHIFAGSRLLAFHGHQEDTLNRAMQAQDGSAAVRLATEVSRLSNPLSLAIQKTIDLAADFFSDPTMPLDDLFDAQWHAASPPENAGGFSSPRWCDRGGRNVLQSLVQGLPFAQDLRAVLVGHSHRPGISSLLVDGRVVPLVDVGSWVSGRSQFVIASEGEMRLWTLT